MAIVRTLSTTLSTVCLLIGIVALPGRAVAQAPPPATASPSSSPSTSLKTQLEKTWDDNSLAWTLGILLLLGGSGSYLGVWWFRPRWLLKLPSQDITLPWTEWTVSVGVVRWLKYRNRALDAWVEQYWPIAQREFLALQTVRDRQIHLPLPVCLGQAPQQKVIETFSGQNLAATVQKKSFLVLISGEGGAGKTSLACQIAQWGLTRTLAPQRLLPVLIETELDERRSLLAVIQGQLEALTNQANPLDPELVQYLLRRQRVLVIVDHLSEMGEVTRQQITPDLPDFPAKALVITTRLDQSFATLPNKTILSPLRIEGSRLSQFMDIYLTSQGKRNLFEDEDYFAACGRLSSMVGQRTITVLLARLYADQMIQQQQGAGGSLPASIPELMLSYLNQLNRSIDPAHQRPNQPIHRDAQAVAWECLRQTYRPQAAKTADALAALEALNKDHDQNGEPNSEPNPGQRLAYLETRLRLLQTLEPGDKLRIVLDPLAEYLAALWFVEQMTRLDPTTQDPEAAWQQFFDHLATGLERSNETPEAVQGFLLAVRDCCLLKQQADPNLIPATVPDTLVRQAGLDPDLLRQAQEKRRIRLLMSELAAPELEYRLRAAADLGQRGTAAAPATPNLLGLLDNRDQPLKLRQAAAKTLGEIGTGSDALLARLQDASDDPVLRRSAAEALGRQGAAAAELTQILNDQSQPLALRQGAAVALRGMATLGSRANVPGSPPAPLSKGGAGTGSEVPLSKGDLGGKPVPMLMVTLNQGTVSTQVRPIPIWQEPLGDGLTLDLVKIPAGAFDMGSPPEEASRDWYQYSYPELKDVDVEQQHRVTVPEFYCGQTPITQAQWHWVATTLPAINRELEPDPANFKGPQRPVELVSWNDALEFCARLSQATGKTYRLPSEAEWEYATRAGTTTPFHCGDTLTPDLANYDGNYTYGDGVKGIFRNQTTEVGSFGMVNAFGLADCHGTVFEWCLDPWHPSYAGAPTDGSAWTEGGDDRYRLLRGGSWYSYPDYCRSANRLRAAPTNRYHNNGFRVVCLPPWT